ncbi:hypothetical protein [Henriciella sp.]|uniref:LolA family protein n=1 Tax=Henriciella sp. TaxID=1968823 RepID=UPI00261D77D3|nr:hypothetical protein [Henriciella sp.]
MSLVIVPLVFLVSVGTPAAASTACPSFEDATEVSGQRSFKQVRTLDGVDQPLISTGTVSIEPDRVVWTVTNPLNITTTITEAGITQSVEGGPAEPIETGGGMNPMLTTGLLDVLGGNMEDAESYFSIETMASLERRWRVKLSPKGEQVSDYIAGMTVSGCATVDEIRLDQTNGDEMIVTFQDG